MSAPDRRERALRIALTGAAVVVRACEAVGLAAAIWPAAGSVCSARTRRCWRSARAYLRWVGPAYGFFGLGLSLYFASQGAGRLAWPLIGGFLRCCLAVGGGWLALRLTGSMAAVFAMLGVALAFYGCIVAAAVGSGAWFRGEARLG